MSATIFFSLYKLLKIGRKQMQQKNSRYVKQTQPLKCWFVIVELAIGWIALNCHRFGGAAFKFGSNASLLWTLNLNQSVKLVSGCPNICSDCMKQLKMKRLKLNLLNFGQWTSKVHQKCISVLREPNVAESTPGRKWTRFHTTANSLDSSAVSAARKEREEEEAVSGN